MRVCAALLAAAALHAQDAAPLAFEVASVKPAALSGANNRAVMSDDPGRISYTTVALGALITKAYDLRNYQLTAPDWVFTERYDIAAKLPAGATEAQIPLMLRTLLAERFQMVLHREVKPIPVYEIGLARNGFQGKRSGNPDGLRISISSKGRRLTGAASLSTLATNLSALLDRPVLDVTGVAGIYDIDLEWTPDDREMNSIVGMKVAMATREGKVPEAGDGTAAPSLSTVLRDQLGLRLEPKKSPVEILIVDRANKVPTQN